MSDKPMSILDHLEALRHTLIVSLIALIPGTAVGWYIKKVILKILIAPVIAMHYKLVYIGATEAFMAELTIAVMAGVAIASPVIAYQFWKFILPALHAKERKIILLLVPISMVLFAGGIVFGYFTVFTYGIQFLLSFGGEGLTPMLSLGKYLSFAFWFLMPFGLMFEMPLVILALVKVGVVNPKFLASKRKWVLIISFVVAAVVTPTTDMLSQTIMAVAMYVLYEVSIWLSYLMKPKKGLEKVQSEDKEQDPPDPDGPPTNNPPNDGGDESTPLALSESQEQDVVEVLDKPETSVSENQNPEEIAMQYKKMIEKEPEK